MADPAPTENPEFPEKPIIERTADWRALEWNALERVVYRVTTESGSILFSQVLRVTLHDRAFTYQLDVQSVGDSLRDLVLAVEHVGHLALVSLAPEMLTIRHADELRGNADPVAGLTAAAF